MVPMVLCVQQNTIMGPKVPDSNNGNASSSANASFVAIKRSLIFSARTSYVNVLCVN